METKGNERVEKKRKTQTQIQIQIQEEQTPNMAKKIKDKMEWTLHFKWAIILIQIKTERET